MPHNFASVSASAIFLAALTACSPGPDPNRSADAEAASEAANLDDAVPATMGEVDREVAASPAYTLGASEFEIDELLGEEIYGADRKSIARVADLKLDGDGRIESIIFANGGLEGLGSEHGEIRFDAVTLTLDKEGEPRVRVEFGEDALDAVTKWSQEGANDYSLASELIGTTAPLAASEDSARLIGMIADLDGSVTQLLVAEGPIDEIVSKPKVIDIAKLTRSPDGTAISLDITEAMLERAPTYVERDDG